MTSDPSALAPQRCREQDLAALIGLLAIFEGFMTAGRMPDDLAGRIRSRLVDVGLLGPGADERDLRQAINDLNHRLRHALGEYDAPPLPIPVPDIG